MCAAGTRRERRPPPRQAAQCLGGKQPKCTPGLQQLLTCAHESMVSRKRAARHVFCAAHAQLQGGRQVTLCAAWLLGRAHPLRRRSQLAVGRCWQPWQPAWWQRPAACPPCCVTPGRRSALRGARGHQPCGRRLRPTPTQATPTALPMPLYCVYAPSATSLLLPQPVARSDSTPPR